MRQTKKEYGFIKVYIINFKYQRNMPKYIKMNSVLYNAMQCTHLNI